MSNPQSANIVSPGKRLRNKSEFSVMCLQLTRQHHQIVIVLTLTCGVIPTKYFSLVVLV